MKNILLILLLIVGVLAAVIATRPDTFNVERSGVVEAPRALVYELVTDLKRFDEWSPWAERDPNMKKTFADVTVGKGASYSWAGNDQVGKGTMSITDVEADKTVNLKLEFVEPFASEADVKYDLADEGDKTKFTWSMGGKNDFIGKAMSLFMSMDAVIGKDFEQGLAKLNTFAKAEAEKRAAEAKAAAEAEAKAAAEAAAAAAAAATEGSSDVE